MPAVTDEGGRVLIAQGQPWGGLPILVVMSTQFTVLFTIVIFAGAHFDHVRDYPLAVLGLFTFASLFGAVYVLIWRATVGRVRYEVDGARIVVSRGRKVVAELDTTDYHAFYVVDRLSVPRLFIPRGQVLDPLAGMPYLVAEKWINRWDFETVRLPRILLFGRKAADDFETRLLAALDRPPVAGRLR
jgi:hypothetical protein